MSDYFASEGISRPHHCCRTEAEFLFIQNKEKVMRDYRKGLVDETSQTEDGGFVQFACDHFMHEVEEMVKSQETLGKEIDHAKMIEKSKDVVEVVKRRIVAPNMSF